MPVTQHHSEEIEKFLDGGASFSDMMFGFLDGSNESEENSGDSVDPDEIVNHKEVEQNKIFWEAQQQLLQNNTVVGPVVAGTVCRRSSRFNSEKRVPIVTYASPNGGAPLKFPPEVLDKSSNPKKGEVRVVIKLNFRAEFEMARANEDYNKLVTRLPTLLVGKTERVNALINILSAAAKECMKENKMHVAPWRKHKHMKANMLGTYERTTAAPLLVVHLERRPQKPKASMLTFDLMDRFPGLHYAPVQLVW
ncbi:Basic helix-loop-helix DNA-binding superfamily protein, putative isoform 1 [Hibiscus syriacus]|uniref:Basic helix-loop-helix DNA-binding superfamily protein, putative isoform 1 n=1 Tax=Hibiscus syriacus TaxID=106335 RepID=A0A6A2YNL0_HIBSY|nr:Basic helix-loop-helix DNA-binding superfamily protein, putative isoform 1 [Hibiscus syriacus]